MTPLIVVPVVATAAAVVAPAPSATLPGSLAVAPAPSATAWAPLVVELVPSAAGCEIDLGTEGGEHGLGTAAVHDGDALVTDFEALAEVGNEDLIPLSDTRIEGAHMIARSQLHSG